MTSQYIGKYEIIATLGRGSMGVVYKAKDPEIGRVVAIKTLRSVFLSDDEAGNEAMQRFRQEARSAGSLHHPNIVTIFEAGRTASGSPYIVMELIEGTSLETFIKEGNGLEPPAVLHYLAQVAAAVDYAHSHGIIHRDLKPSNVLVDARNRPHLLDFGVAKISDTSLTPAGTVVGTPSYMSPEQIRGEELDSATDVFSLAVVAYEAFTRHRPFPGSDFSSVVSNIIHKEPLRFADVGCTLPLQLETVLLQALDKDKSGRPASALELIDMLAGALGALVDGNGLVGGFTTGMTLDDLAAADSSIRTVSTAQDRSSQQVRVSSPASRTVPQVQAPETSVPEEPDELLLEEAPMPQGPPTEELPEAAVEAASMPPDRTQRSAVWPVLVVLLLVGAVAVHFGGLLRFDTMVDQLRTQAAKVAEPAPDGSGDKSDENEGRSRTVGLLAEDGSIDDERMRSLSIKELNAALIEPGSGKLARALVQEAARRADPKLIAGLNEAITYKEVAVRVEVLKVFRDLRFHSQKAGFETIASRLYDEDFIVRGWAAKVLGLVATEQARQALLGRMQVEDHKVVKKVIQRSLERLGSAPLPDSGFKVNTD